MMICPYCEADVSVTARKCRRCGEWIMREVLNEKEKTTSWQHIENPLKPKPPKKIDSGKELIVCPQRATVRIKYSRFTYQNRDLGDYFHTQRFSIPKHFPNVEADYDLLASLDTLSFEQRLVGKQTWAGFAVLAFKENSKVVLASPYIHRCVFLFPGNWDMDQSRPRGHYGKFFESPYTKIPTGRGWFAKVIKHTERN
jgi:ribosomal protein L40E